MRKLLNTLFVINEDAYLTLDGENLVVTRNKQETHRYALHTLEGIVCFTYAGASPALMGACARRGIDLCFFDPYGRFQARTVGEERGNVLLRQTQYRESDDMAQSCRYAWSFILGKVYNARWVLERATRDHPQRVPVEKLKRTSTQLAAALRERSIIVRHFKAARIDQFLRITVGTDAQCVQFVEALQEILG